MRMGRDHGRPVGRREAVTMFGAVADCSERHACGQLEVLRAMARYRPLQSRQSEANGCLRTRLRQLAKQRRRWRIRRLPFDVAVLHWPSGPDAVQAHVVLVGPLIEGSS